MKKVLSVILTSALILCACALSGCGEKKPAETEPATKTAEAKTSRFASDELESYLRRFVEGDNPIYGTWQIENMPYLSFIFRNDELAEMVMDNEGDFTSLRLNTKSKTLGVSFMLGLNGVYSYSLSKDQNTLTLSLNGKKTVLKRQDDYSILPKAPKKVTIDDDLLGWWQSEEKQIYFFGSDGIMYSNTISMETAYTYSAELGKINAVYNYGGEVKKYIKYNIKAGKLQMDNQEFKRFTP